MKIGNMDLVMPDVFRGVINGDKYSRKQVPTRLLGVQHCTQGAWIKPAVLYASIYGCE